MSYCKCGGYLGDGGPNLYAGRFCSCSNPVAQNITVRSTNNINVISEEVYDMYDLADQNSELKKILNEAIEVIKWYAEGNGNFDYDLKSPKGTGGAAVSQFFGKKAREFLTKVKK